MRCLLVLMGVVTLACLTVSFVARNRVKRQHEIDVLYEHMCLDEDGRRDFYCLVFCPFLHDLFVYSLRQPIACAFNMKFTVDCSRENSACTDWCRHLYDQMNGYYLHQRPKEWDVCARGDRPVGCDGDHNCVRWCDMVHGSYQNTSAAIVGCLNTGVPPANCDDRLFCEDVCNTAERQSQDVDEQVLKCGWTGTAPWP